MCAKQVFLFLASSRQTVATPKASLEKFPESLCALARRARSLTRRKQRGEKSPRAQSTAAPGLLSPASKRAKSSGGIG